MNGNFRAPRVITFADMNAQCMTAASSQPKHTLEASMESQKGQPRLKRPRALDIPTPLRAAPEAWSMLNSQIQYAWTYNAAVAKLISDGTPRGMHSEDLSSRIIEQGSKPCTLPFNLLTTSVARTNPSPNFNREDTYDACPHRSHLSRDNISHIYHLYPATLTSSNTNNALVGDPKIDINPDGSLILPPSNSFAPTILSLVDDWKPLCHQPKIASIDDATAMDSRSFEIAESIRHQIKEQYMRFHEEEMEFASEMA